MNVLRVEKGVSVCDNKNIEEGLRQKRLGEGRGRPRLELRQTIGEKMNTPFEVPAGKLTQKFAKIGRELVRGVGRGTPLVFGLDTL